MVQEMNLDEVLRRVQKPARYIGKEWNSVLKGWGEVEVRVVLIYPDAYEIGMSSLGLTILYELLNRQPYVLAERAYAPWVDMSAELRQHGLHLFSLESRRPLCDFDILGFSLGYELTYTNVLNILDLAGIPFLAGERNESHPLVVGGGSCVLNPEPMADFFDLFVIGEGEEVVLELVEAFRRWKREGGRREDLLRSLARIPGIYVPRFYEVEYRADGYPSRIEPKIPEAARVVERRFVSPLPPPPVRPVVPYVEVVHDRAAIEIQRGCTRGCRFCQAGVIYRPIRERSPEEILAAAEEILRNSGYEELSLLSLSTTDYPQIEELVSKLSSRYQRSRLNLSLPSLRPDAFSVKLAKLAFGRKSSLTFAPEAGTERLRRVINKPIADEEILGTIKLAASSGWNSFKLYFMLGLPTEEEEDVEGIISLARKMRNLGSGRGPNIRASISPFVPKPHTPFQWVRQASPEEMAPKLQLLRRGFKKAGVRLSWQDPRLSLLEGVFSRGDRRLGRVLRRAWELGCLFDGWREHFKWELWQQAFWDSDLDPNFYLRERSLEELLPWSHIDSGVSSAYLRRELERSRRGELTPDCRSSCQACGLQRWDKACRDKLRQNSEKA